MAMRAAATVGTKFTPLKPTLVDVPVSNHGARIRFVIYSKGLEDTFDIQSPKLFNGLKSPDYLKLHPMGKLPVLVLPTGQSIPESEVILQYICEAYSGTGPDFVPHTPEMRAKANWLARLHDVYISPIQGAMYRSMGAEERAQKILQINEIMDVLETQVDEKYLVGNRFSTADAVFFPTVKFMEFMLPKYFGWGSIFKGRPRMEKWWATVGEDPVAKRVILEIHDALLQWEESDRWEKNGIIDQVKDSNYTWTF